MHLYAWSSHAQLQTLQHGLHALEIFAFCPASILPPLSICRLDDEQPAPIFSCPLQAVQLALQAAIPLGVEEIFKGLALYDEDGQPRAPRTVAKQYLKVQAAARDGMLFGPFPRGLH